MFGPDVAKTRADDLDRKAIAYVKENQGCGVLDLGCGAGGQAERLAAAGANVLGVDIHDYENKFAINRKKIQGQQSAIGALSFLQVDIRNLSSLVHESFDVCILQRTIHYLQYQEAVELLRSIQTFGARRLYISVTGIDTDIGAGYACSRRPLRQRYCSLDAETADTFSIHEPLCLYNTTDFIQLLTESGWQVEELWTSAFGNHKAVCVA